MHPGSPTPPHPVQVLRIVGESAFLRNCVNAIVRPRVRDIVLQRKRQPVRGLDQRSVHIAGYVFSAPLPPRDLRLSTAIDIKTSLRCAHRDEIIEAVTAVSAHVVRDRPQAVRRVEVAVSLRMHGSTPETFALARK